ncbi:MAG: HAMP domain-containing sensor histidine kinase [Gammaproteobacteria bacterium]|nr:HAMP domain-containing sensor histidine kinase [Gammaproteobacteria bacterium]
MFRKASLKQLVFLCIFLAVLAPMVILVGGSIQYGQNIYQQEVDDEMFAGLDRTIAAIGRRLFIEQDLIRALSQVPAVQELLPALHQTRNGLYRLEYDAARLNANRFLEIFQSVRRSLGTIRILSYEGDTLIKVQRGSRSNLTLENFDGIMVIENGSESNEFKAQLQSLNDTDVGSITLPMEFDEQDAALNTVIPLQFKGETVGYLSIAPPLQPLDRTFDVAPRPHGSKMMVAEINPDVSERHGRILYADDPATTFFQNTYSYIAENISPVLLSEEAGSDVHKHVDESGGVWYFRHYLPYPDRLIGWMVAYQTNQQQIFSPFSHAGTLLWAIVILTLLFGVLLAVLATQQVTRPVSILTERLVNYARGEKTHRIKPSGSTELRTAHAAFNEMADELDQLEQERKQTQRVILQHAKLTSIGQLAGGIAHELRNPLSNIFSLIKLVKRGIREPSDEVQSDLSSIRSEAERASNIIQGLLDYSRQGPIKMTDFNLSSWLEETVRLTDQLASNRRIHVHLDKPVSSMVHGDANMLQQAMINVLINSLQATPEGGEVFISVEDHSDKVVVNVLDQGEGIPEEIEDQILDPFFTTKPEGEGVGFGLPITISILQRHGGNFKLDNSSQGGAIARILFPKKPSVDAETE